VRGNNANCPTRFCHVSEFKAPNCLHYNAVNVGLLPNVHVSNLDQNCTLHNCTFPQSSQAEIQHYFWQKKGHKYCSEFTKTCHFSKKYSFLSGEKHGPSSDLTQGGVASAYPPTCRPNQAFWIRPCVRQNSVQIYATVCKVGHQQVSNV